MLSEERHIKALGASLWHNQIALATRMTGLIKTEMLVRHSIALVGLICIVAIIGPAVLAGLQYVVHLLKSDGTAFHLHPTFRINQDNGFSENIIQAKLLLTSCLFLLNYRMTGNRLFVSMAALFAFMWFDDSLRYHEVLGQRFTEWFSLKSVAGLRPQDIGELMAWAIAGICLVPVLLWSLIRVTRDDIRFAIPVGLCFVLIVTFGMGVDMLHIVIAPDSRIMDVVLTYLEDGGEAIAITLAGAFAILATAINYQDRRADERRNQQAPVAVRR
jgi:hypothetical protein